MQAWLDGDDLRFGRMALMKRERVPGDRRDVRGDVGGASRRRRPRTRAARTATSGSAEQTRTDARSSSSPPARAASARPRPAPASPAASPGAARKVAVIDFDVGLRNLDLIMGCERRVVYDFVNVIHGELHAQAGADQGQALRQPVRAGRLADARQGRADQGRRGEACSRT